MSRTATVSTSRQRHVVPTLMALGLMGVALHAADPVITPIGGTLGTSATVTFTVDWGVDVGGFDPLFNQTTAQGTGGDFRLFEVLLANQTTLPVPNGAAQTGVSLVVPTVVSATARKTTLSYTLTSTNVKLYAQVPANAAYLNSNGTNTGIAVPGAATSQLIYTKLATPVIIGNAITSPLTNTTSVSRYPSLVVRANVDDDETAGAVNALISNTDDFVVNVVDSVSSAIVGSAKFRKTGVAYSGANPTAQRQSILVSITEPLTVGVHTLTADIRDPVGQLAGTSPTITILVWDRPTLQVNGETLLTGSTFTSDRTNSFEFTGTKFKIGADSSTVTLTVNGVAATIDSGITDPTKFRFTMPTLAASTSNAVVLTQTYSGSGVAGSPSIVSNFTINNNVLDTTPPVIPTVGVPSNATSVASLRPTITGQGEIGSVVQLRFTDDQNVVVAPSATVTVGADSFFNFTSTEWAAGGGFTLLANRTYSIEVKATDAANNTTDWVALGQTLVTPASIVKPTISATSTITVANSTNYSNTAAVALAVNLADYVSAITGGVTGLATTDFVVTNGTIAVSPTPALTTAGTNTLTLSVTATAAGIPTTVTLPSNAFSVTASGLNNIASNTYTFMKDAVVPTFTTSVINNGLTTVGATGSIGSGSFSVVLTSNEPLSSGDASKVTVTFGGTGGSGTKGAGSLSSDGLRYTVPYTSVVAVGTTTNISIAVTAGALIDLALNTSAAAVAASVRTYDVTAPTQPTLTSVATPIGKVAPIIFVATFPEAVTGFDQTSFDITNGVATAFLATPTTYTLTVMPGEGPTPVKATVVTNTVVKDLAGNQFTTSALFLNRTYDSTSPRILSLSSSTTAPTSTDLKPTNLTSIPCSVIFSEPVTGITASSFKVENGTITNFAGSNSVYTFKVDVSLPTNVNKVVRVVLPAGLGSDLATNTNSSVSVLVRNYDGVVPTLTFAAPVLAQTTSVNDAKGSFTVAVANDVLLSKYDQSQLGVIGGTIDSITTTTSGSGAATKITGFTVNVTFPRGAGNVVTLTALPGVVTDMAGNKNVTGSVQLIVPGAG